MTSQAKQTEVERLEAALAVHRRVTIVYQAAVRKLADNLGMLGRGDVAKSVLRELLEQVTLAGGELSHLEDPTTRIGRPPGLTKDVLAARKAEATTQQEEDDDDDLAG